MEYIEMLKVYVISDGFCLELVCYDIVIRLLLSIGWKKIILEVWSIVEYLLENMIVELMNFL